MIHARKKSNIECLNKEVKALSPPSARSPWRSTPLEVGPIPLDTAPQFRSVLHAGLGQGGIVLRILFGNLHLSLTGQFLAYRYPLVTARWPRVPLRACMLSYSVVSDSYDPMDCSPPGSSVHGIFQARILEWVAIFSSGVEDLPNSGIEPTSLVSPAFQIDSLPTEPLGKLPESL